MLSRRVADQRLLLRTIGVGDDGRRAAAALFVGHELDVPIDGDPDGAGGGPVVDPNHSPRAPALATEGRGDRVSLELQRLLQRHGTLARRARAPHLHRLWRRRRVLLLLQQLLLRRRHVLRGAAFAPSRLPPLHGVRQRRRAEQQQRQACDAARSGRRIGLHPPRCQARLCRAPLQRCTARLLVRVGTAPALTS